MSPLYLHITLRIKERRKREKTKGLQTEIRCDPINQDPYSSAEKVERGRGTIGYPPFRVSLCYGRVRDRFCSAASKVGSGTRNKARAERQAGGKGDRNRGGGPPSPYIISSPERVAIISRQWPTDRSASQKDLGPIIAATHRRRRSGQSWGPCAFSFAFFPPRTNSFLPRRDPRRRLLDASRAARGETQTIETGCLRGMRESNIPQRDSYRAKKFLQILKTYNFISTAKSVILPEISEMYFFF